MANPNPVIITSTVNMYTDVFIGYFTQFLEWGKWLFFGFLVIAIVWMCLWRAFDRNSFNESMPGFLKEFFVVAFFFTIMINALPWLSSIIQTATVMGSKLGHMKVDPSSIISNGIAIGNLIIRPTKDTGLLTNGFAILVTGAAYLIVLYVFIRIAIELAITIISTYFLISMSGLLLAFSAFPFTRSISRKTLDNVIAKSFKLLALYTVIAAGGDVFAKIASILPTDKIDNFDIYGWTVAAAGLFYVISMNIPNEVGRLVSDTIQEHRGADAAAIIMAASRIASMAAPVAGKVAGSAVSAAANLGTIAGSTTANAMAHFNKASSTPDSSAIGSMGAAVGGAAKDLGSAIGGRLSDQFKHIASKMTGGPGIKQTTASGYSRPLASVAERMYAAGQDVKSSYSAMPKQGQPSSAGRKAAASSSTRSKPILGGGASKPSKDT